MGSTMISQLVPLALSFARRVLHHPPLNVMSAFQGPILIQQIQLIVNVSPQPFSIIHRAHAHYITAILYVRVALMIH